MKYAEHQFDLSLSKIGGMSKREHLESLERQTGKRPKELEPPNDQIPLLYLFEWWHELRCGASEQGIDYPQILSWSILAGVELSQYEIGGLMSIDRKFLSIVTEQQKKHG